MFFWVVALRRLTDGSTQTTTKHLNCKLLPIVFAAISFQLHKSNTNILRRSILSLLDVAINLGKV
jgi:hypothetical protein